MSLPRQPSLSQTLHIGLHEGTSTVEFDGKNYRLDHIVEHLCYGYCPERQEVYDEIEDMLSGFADCGPEITSCKITAHTKLP